MKNIYRFFCERIDGKRLVPYWEEVAKEGYLDGLSYTDAQGRTCPIFAIPEDDPHLLIANTPESCRVLERYMFNYLDKNDMLEHHEKNLHRFFQKKYEELEKIKRMTENRRNFIMSNPPKPENMLTFSEILDRFEFPYRWNPLEAFYRAHKKIVLPNSSTPVPIVEYVQYKKQRVLAIYKEGLPILMASYPNMHEKPYPMGKEELGTKKVHSYKCGNFPKKAGKDEDLLKDIGLLKKIFVEAQKS